MARLPRCWKLPAMLSSNRTSRVLLVATGRGAAEAGSVPVRRYRLARLRVSPAAAGASRVTRAKRS